MDRAVTSARGTTQGYLFAAIVHYRLGTSLLVDEVRISFPQGRDWLPT